MKWARILILCLSSLVPTVALAADVRVALVIGNSAYDAVGLLPNPRRDANLVKDALQRDGFAVTMISDATRADMAAALQVFAGQADRADWALVYFAGHGIEVGGVNYLVPTDARLRDDRDAQDEAISLDRVLDTVANARKLRLVILDACRENPFAASMERSLPTRGVDRGLARPEPQAGVLVVYAAAAGAVAADGTGKHSPFTAALVSRMQEPGLEMSRFFNVVTADVLDATHNRQRPFTYGSNPSRGELYFTPPALVQHDTGDGRTWGFLKNSADIATVQSFYDSLQPDNSLRGPVADRLAALRRAQAQSAALAPLPPVPAPKDGEAVAACDRLAASPDDPDRPASVAGVADDRMDAKKAILACKKAMLQASGDRRIQYELGRALDQETRFAEAADVLNRAAAAGSTAAMIHLGGWYYSGRGVNKPDHTTARTWYEKAASIGDPEAMWNLGHLYQFGSWGLDEDQDAARAWFEKAAAAGSAKAIQALIVLYRYHGYGAKPNYDAARGWCVKAAAAGDTDAMFDLGVLYEKGHGVAQDYAAAYAWYEKAATAADAGAMDALSDLYRYGRGVTKDEAAARTWHERAKKQFQEDEDNEPVMITDTGILTKKDLK